ncbi:osteocrin [Patagioenas fasciata monilis]|uniref:Osteocrin n=2 Tax=Patagioenas fasciata TaxID=372321 RepID=A0A1V4KMF1_PATFA|nr:osteocrin [Patagioenas fasciata monilis]
MILKPSNSASYLDSLLAFLSTRAFSQSILKAFWPAPQMLQFQLVVVHLALVITLLQWHSSSVLLAEAAPEPLEPSAALGMGAHPTASEEKSATNLAAKLFLLDELVSLENEVTETKKKRSFPGFGSPIDRISSSSVDAKSKKRKVVELPKRRFGVPLDRIGGSRLGNTKG